METQIQLFKTQTNTRNNLLNNPNSSKITRLVSKDKKSEKSQISFEFARKVSRETGGSLFVGKRKTKRILSSEFAIHLVLKSDQAVKQYAFVNHRFVIEKIIAELSFQSGTKVYEKAINFDHIHLVIRITNEHLYKAWIRKLTAEIVQVINQRTNSELKNFFSYRPYTRTLSGWGKEFREVCDYVKLNQMEIVGLRPNRKF